MIEDLWSGLIAFSGQFIVPDWGSLIPLIPIGLAALVLLYLTWIGYRFATAGPTRRGKRRLPPRTPAGIHMPGPSFAPVLAAIGAFFLVFGVVTEGLWLVVGVVILVITLLYWGREALRDYDAIPAAGGSHATAGGALMAGGNTSILTAAPGPLPAPARAVPAGVHIPPPSFRPLLVSIAMTALVGGVVVGGWALFLGLIAIVVAGLGWLWDSRREYAAVERADTTGHLDLGGSPAWPMGTLAALAIIVALALLVTSGVLSGSGDGSAVPSGAPASGAPGASVAPGGGGGSASEAPAATPAADVVVVAENIDFTTKAITAPAGAPFTMALDNRDPVPHDIVIRDAGGKDLFKGDLVTGPAVVVYDVPALPAGQYTFVCTVHPNMTGTVTAQ